MTTNDFSPILEAQQIKPTAIRLLVYRAMTQYNNTFSLSELENELVSIDKSTLFRTITLFDKHHLIHSVDDGSGSLKYCLCHNQGSCEVIEQHCHFYCENCKITYCLNDIEVPHISLPEGYQVHEMNFVLKGICNTCSGKK